MKRDPVAVAAFLSDPLNEGRVLSVGGAGERRKLNQCPGPCDGRDVMTLTATEGVHLHDIALRYFDGQFEVVAREEER